MPTRWQHMFMWRSKKNIDMFWLKEKLELCKLNWKLKLFHVHQQHPLLIVSPVPSLNFSFSARPTLLSCDISCVRNDNTEGNYLFIVCHQVIDFYPASIHIVLVLNHPSKNVSICPIYSDKTLTKQVQTLINQQYFNFFFQKNKTWHFMWIVCLQTIHMKYQVLFSLKSKRKY